MGRLTHAARHGKTARALVDDVSCRAVFPRGAAALCSCAATLTALPALPTRSIGPRHEFTEPLVMRGVLLLLRLACMGWLPAPQSAGYRMNPMHLGIELLATAQNQSLHKLR